MAGVLSLPEYLQAGRRRPFEWGRCDCFLWACDWVVARRGVDPAAPYRGRYRTALGAQRHIKRAGGWEALVRQCFEGCGIAPTDKPRPGDVGLVMISGVACLAIRLGDGWAGKSPRGVAWARDALTVTAWSI